MSRAIDDYNARVQGILHSTITSIPEQYRVELEYIVNNLPILDTIPNFISGNMVTVPQLKATVSVILYKSRTQFYENRKEMYISRRVLMDAAGEYCKQQGLRVTKDYVYMYIEGDPTFAGQSANVEQLNAFIKLMEEIMDCIDSKDHILRLIHK